MIIQHLSKINIFVAKKFNFIITYWSSIDYFVDNYLSGSELEPDASAIGCTG
jgi:hypothetical protein